MGETNEQRPTREVALADRTFEKHMQESHSPQPGTRRHPSTNRRADFANLVIDILNDEVVNKVSSTLLVRMINSDGMIGVLYTAAQRTTTGNLSLMFTPPHSVKQICISEARQLSLASSVVP